MLKNSMVHVVSISLQVTNVNSLLNIIFILHKNCIFILAGINSKTVHFNAYLFHHFPGGTF